MAEDVKGRGFDRGSACTGGRGGTGIAGAEATALWSYVSGRLSRLNTTLPRSSSAPLSASSSTWRAMNSANGSRNSGR